MPPSRRLPRTPRDTRVEAADAYANRIIGVHKQLIRPANGIHTPVGMHPIALAYQRRWDAADPAQAAPRLPAGALPVRQARTPVIAPGHYARPAPAGDGPLRRHIPGTMALCATVPGPDAVRYMSAHSRKQPDSQGRSGTTTARSTTARTGAYAQATGRFRRWWQVLCPASRH